MKSIAKNQRGDVELLVITLVLLFGGCLFISYTSFTRAFNSWAGDCRKANGFIQKVKYDRWECFVDGKQETLPGWEDH